VVFQGWPRKEKKINESNGKANLKQTASCNN